VSAPLIDWFPAETKLINKSLKELLIKEEHSLGEQKLIEAINYTLLSGGKRFRAILSGLTAKCLGQNFEYSLPYGMAVEMIHTYSLIHDDLPCMDNDDLRRGQPSNHKAFDETTALLAGDALQSYAFYLLSKSYKSIGTPKSSALSCLSKAAFQMVLGQSLDLSKEVFVDQEYIKEMHLKKTGAIINASVVGMAYLCKAETSLVNALDVFSKSLGLAFQIADDIQDYDPNKVDEKNIVSVMGHDKSIEYLAALSGEAKKSLKLFKPELVESFNDLIDYNLTRV